MKKRYSHITPVLFLFFLLLPVLCMVALQSSQWYLKSTAGERMAHHQLITLSIPVEQVVWHKKEKELSIDGKLFDIRQYQLVGETIHVLGYFDDEEMNIARLLSLFMPDEKQSTLLHFFLVLQCFMTPLVFISFEFLQRRIGRIGTIFSFYLPFPLCLSEKQPPKR